MTTASSPARSPWHQGERQLHERQGNAAHMEAVGHRFLRDFMPDQHRAFFAQLPFVVLGGVDAQGYPWATLVEGSPGFMHSPHAQQLVIGASLDEEDPVRLALTPGAPVGVLGIEPHSRRRNRMNGVVQGAQVNGLSVRVVQSFGNCPQYIRERVLSFEHPPGQPNAGPVERLSGLDDVARATIAGADTFFVASHFKGDAQHPEPSVDVSHRGGKVGFVKVTGQVLHIPDFAGNQFFNTLGNLITHPVAGLVFVDFATGDVLQLSGSVEIVFDGPEVDTFQGAQRLWRVTVTQVVRRRNALALRWRTGEESPSSLITGSWPQTTPPLPVESPKAAWEDWRVTRVDVESSTVRSFYLAPANGLALPPYRAGQHLPVRLPAQAGQPALLRTYTLSAAPSDGFYRLSVKREGRASSYLHDHIRPGDVIEVRAPQGDFALDGANHRPVLLLAGGIGVTPLLAMLRERVFEGLRQGQVQPTTLIYATHQVADRAFDAELTELRQRGGNAIRVIRVVSQPEPGMTKGHDFEARGRVDPALLRSALSTETPNIYLCGPAPFMQSIYDSLRALGVTDEHIHAEAFGPAALRRESSSFGQPPLPVATTAVPVRFSQSAKEVRWTPGSASLLELAEQMGLTPEFGCRAGSCGTCRTRVVEGQVSYTTQPAFHTAPHEALLCCAQPAQGTRLVLAL